MAPPLLLAQLVAPVLARSWRKHIESGRELNNKKPQQLGRGDCQRLNSFTLRADCPLQIFRFSCRG
jgi:hypothetical protein